MKPAQYNWQFSKIDHQLIDLALKEDLGVPPKDITTESVFSKDEEKKQAKAQIICKENGGSIVCGIKIIQAIFEKLGNTYSLETNFKDGDRINNGETLISLQDQLNNLLRGERVALNFLGHLSGIATLTSKFVKKLKGTKLKILDTRKTTPGLRHLEKYAVFCGGGVNHRQGLTDAVLIKNNHVDLKGGMKKTLEEGLNKIPKNTPIIVEIRNLEELDEALRVGKGTIDRILLDNMDPSLLQDCVKKTKGIFETEASGQITLENIRSVAETAVDYASIGIITHSAKSIDFSMRIRNL